jgi:Leucine-rich repeat (LRR) protein
MEEAIKRVNQCIEKKETTLNLSHLGLEKLPNKLPDSLRILYCYNNELKELPNYLPNSLQILWCDNNELKELANNLPNSLQILWCDNNELKELPNNLPNSLQELLCYNNKYLHITKEQAVKYQLEETPNYHKIARNLQHKIRLKQRIKRLKFCKQLREHAEVFLLKPGNYFAQQLANKNKDNFLKN